MGGTWGPHPGPDLGGGGWAGQRRRAGAVSQEHPAATTTACPQDQVHVSGVHLGVPLHEEPALLYLLVSSSTTVGSPSTLTPAPPSQHGGVPAGSGRPTAFQAVGVLD